MKKRMLIAAVAFLATTSLGCYRPYEPVVLETLGTNEEGFLIPYTGDLQKQTSTNSEDFLKKNMIQVKQVQIPQQFIQTGFKYYDGNWQNAARLIKVDKSPVTREWTADPNSGTSTRNQAIWVMTSDQVEMSTGWTVTARIGSRDDAVKFLHNYPSSSDTTAKDANGNVVAQSQSSLAKVMDEEVRAKIQTVFGLEVTDLPMQELREKATPHINKVTKEVTDFFAARGITITNIGITGGFVYKDASIQKTLVEVFNAEQERVKKIAATGAQIEENKRLQLAADAKAKAIFTEKDGEAKGIERVTQARQAELEAAKADLSLYFRLKQLDVMRDAVARWQGTVPSYFTIGQGGPTGLLNLPAPAEAAK